MAISINDGFELKSGVALDSRQVLSKQEMLDISDYDLPDVYFAVCKDDGKLYVFNKTNDIDVETGKFRITSASGEETSYMTVSELDAMWGEITIIPYIAE